MSVLAKAVGSRKGKNQNRRKGNIIVFSAFLMVFMMFMIAVSVDVGYIYTMQAQLDRAVDSAALAGAQELVNGTSAAQAKATEYLVRNPVGTSTTHVDETQLAAQTTAFHSSHSSDYQLQYGNWNPTTKSFSETGTNPGALQVTMTYPNLPFFFGRVMGKETFTISSSATAMYQPRDIVVVLDYSGSMNDDTSFAAIGKLSKSVVETSLLNCWADLGPPSWGELAGTPNWVLAEGVPANTASQIPHITVQYRNTSAYVTTTNTLNRVRLTFDGGATQSFTGLSGSTGTFQGSGGNAGKRITRVQVRSWNNSAVFGTNGESFMFSSDSDFVTHLGLNTVTYPYAGGSWTGYVQYVRASSGENKDAGYQYKFGGMNFVDYMLTNYPSNAEFADGWKCRAEPVYALKDSTAVFMDFIGSVNTQDRVALVIYDAANGNAILESGFTSDLASISNIVNHRQAGHYHNYTNIGAGMQLGRETLNTSARPNSCKLMVLMTDGLANWNNGSYNLSAAANHVSSEAAACAAAKYKIFSLSLGVDADTSTMQSVADVTNGKHFNVPGGADFQSMHTQLQAAFKEIADARPMLLVK